MKIQNFSDTHCFGTYIPPVTDADVLVCIGDIDAGLKFEEWVRKLIEVHQKPFVFIPGNHDFYLDRTLDEWLSYYASLDIENFHLLQNEMVVINGYNFIGSTFWTNYQDNPTMEIACATSGIKDFTYIRGMSVEGLKTIEIKGMNAEAVYQIDKLIVDNDLDMDKTLMFFHFPPATFCNYKRERSLIDGHYTSNYDNKILYEWAAKLICYGHTHQNYDYVKGNTRFVCNPLGGFHENGATRNPDFINGLVIEV